MQKNEKTYFKKNILSVCFFVAFLSGGVAALFLARQPSERAQVFLFELSLQRIVFIFGALLLALFFLAISIRLWKNAVFYEKILVWVQREDIFAPLLGITVILTGLFIAVAFFIPPYRFDAWAGYVDKLRPLLVWGAFLSMQTLGVLLVSNKRFVARRNEWGISVWSVFFLFILIWGLIAWTGLGIRPDDRYWNEVGVPLLNEQILFSLVIGAAFWLLLQKTKNSAKKDLLIVLLLWAGTAFFWINEPLPRNFFAPGPYPPNYELAPYADTAVFDLGGQFALIGQGLFNGAFYARALLSGFLAFLHLLVGQNYSLVVTLQTALFSSLVPIIYYIGKHLHSRLAGLLGAFFVFFKGINAIASSTWILSSHPKYMLTEFPTAILLALFTLWILRWFKGEGVEDRFLILGGGALGLGIMLRTNILFFLPLAVFFFWVKFPHDWRKIFHAALVFLLAFFVTISPWMWRSWKTANRPFFFLDIISEVFHTRYLFSSAEGSFIASQPELPRLENVHLKATQRADFYAVEPKTSPLQFIPNHFFHNISASVLVLPTSFSFHDLRHTVYDAYPYWNKNGTWTGYLTSQDKLGLLWNIFLLALGVGGLWKRWRMSGLVPLFVFLSYHLSNAFARTSGGRYLVPVDWVIFLYYALGITELLFWLAKSLGLLSFHTETEALLNVAGKKTPRKNLFFVLPFFLLVGAITILDQSMPARYAAWTTERVREKISESTNLSEEDLTNFLANPDSRLLWGRGLYPRFYQIGAGEYSVGKDAFSNKDFPRLAFTLIGDFGQAGVVLPLNESPTYFPNGSDVVMLGCRRSDTGVLYPYTDAWLVIVFDDERETVYLREPNLPLQCPLPEPICDDNRICQ
jgi:hypothetical protein